MVSEGKYPHCLMPPPSLSRIIFAPFYYSEARANK